MQKNKNNAKFFLRRVDKLDYVRWYLKHRVIFTWLCLVTSFMKKFGNNHIKIRNGCCLLYLVLKFRDLVTTMAVWARIGEKSRKIFIDIKGISIKLHRHNWHLFQHLHRQSFLDSFPILYFIVILFITSFVESCCILMLQQKNCDAYLLIM